LLSNVGLSFDLTTTYVNQVGMLGNASNLLMFLTFTSLYHLHPFGCTWLNKEILLPIRDFGES
jgi:hypothetical protein